MSEDTELDDYLVAIRDQVCTHCIDRPPGGPPCAPLGKRCGIEANLVRLVEAVHAVHSPVIDPYIAELHDEVCPNCLYRTTNDCPCPLDHLLLLAVQAIEDVDHRRAAASLNGPREL